MHAQSAVFSIPNVSNDPNDLNDPIKTKHNNLNKTNNYETLKITNRTNCNVMHACNNKL